MPIKIDLASVRDNVSIEEWSARVELAAAYRLADLYGMTELTGNHISCCVPGEPGHFLLNPYGMLYDEINASSLIKVDTQGNIVLNATEFRISRAGFVIHSAVHSARSEAFCVMHTHTAAGMAISALKCGLLPICQTSMRFLEMAYHSFDGMAEDEEIGQKLAQDLGQHNYLIMCNHGLLTCGTSIGNAFHAMWRLERSCQTQVMAMSCGTELLVPDQEFCRSVFDKLHVLPGSDTTESYVSPWPAMVRKLERHDPTFKD